MRIITLLLMFLLTFEPELKTLNTFLQEEPENMYSMVYYADYHFDEFLEQGAKSDEELEQFVARYLMHGFETKILDAPGKCTSFVCRNMEGEVLFGRNLDYWFSPVVMLLTNPETGYQCMSASDIAFLGYDEINAPDTGIPGISDSKLLAAPYLTTDGMNEYGVAMSILDCGTARPGVIEAAPTLNTSTAVRMVLENARTVEEAVVLMKQYNYYLGRTPNHFMIADASGRSVVVEFCKGELVTVETPVVTNFDLYDSSHCGVGKDRYAKVVDRLEETGGILSEEEALELLAEVVVPGKAQYSVLYNLTTGDIHAFTKGDDSVVAHFHIDRISNQE